MLTMSILGSSFTFKRWCFADENGPKRLNVSATMINQVYLHEFQTLSICFYENPFAQF
jgi:hypothetical protein